MHALALDVWDPPDACLGAHRRGRHAEPLHDTDRIQELLKITGRTRDATSKDQDDLFVQEDRS